VKIDPAVLQAIAADLRDRACLCPRCAQGLNPAADPAP